MNVSCNLSHSHDWSYPPISGRYFRKHTAHPAGMPAALVSCACCSVLHAASYAIRSSASQLDALFTRPARRAPTVSVHFTLALHSHGQQGKRPPSSAQRDIHATRVAMGSSAFQLDAPLLHPAGLAGTGPAFQLSLAWVYAARGAMGSSAFCTSMNTSSGGGTAEMTKARPLLP